MDASGNSWEEETEIVRLQHGYLTVVGQGRTERRPRNFEYRLRVVSNFVEGSYTKIVEQDGNVAGTGTIQMTITPDRLRMTGHTTWLDRDTGRIEASRVEWEKIS